MSSTPSEPAPEPQLTPVHEAARILGGSPTLYVALLAGGLIEGELVGGEWHVDTAVVGAALAVRNPLQHIHKTDSDNMVGGAA